MPIEHCQFKKEIFNWKTVLWHNNNIINVSIKVECCIKINKTLLSMWLLLKYIHKIKIHKETRGGSIFYYSILTPGSLFYTGQYTIWQGHYLLYGIMLGFVTAANQANIGKLWSSLVQRQTLTRPIFHSRLGSWIGSLMTSSRSTALGNKGRQGFLPIMGDRFLSSHLTPPACWVIKRSRLIAS